MDVSFAHLEADYARLFATMEIRPEWAAEIDRAARRVLKLKTRFLTVERLSGVPWVMVALLALREADLDLTAHLHNGDPLTSWTTHKPANRPGTGKPPFTWEASAVDALAYDGLTALRGWSIELIGWASETYNGFGPRDHGIASGYLWSGTLHYRKGKYVRDGVWDPDFVDRQPGVMPVLARLMALDPTIDFGRLIETGKPTIPQTLAAHPVAVKALASGAATLAAGVPASAATLPDWIWPLLLGAALGVLGLATVDLVRRRAHLADLRID